MANQEDLICKCNSRKVDAGVKKSNRGKKVARARVAPMK